MNALKTCFKKCPQPAASSGWENSGLWEWKARNCPSTFPTSSLPVMMSSVIFFHQNIVQVQASRPPHLFFNFFLLDPEIKNPLGQQHSSYLSGSWSNTCVFCSAFSLNRELCQKANAVPRNNICLKGAWPALWCFWKRSAGINFIL